MILRLLIAASQSVAVAIQPLFVRAYRWSVIEGRRRYFKCESAWNHSCALNTLLQTFCGSPRPSETQSRSVSLANGPLRNLGGSRLNSAALGFGVSTR